MIKRTVALIIMSVALSACGSDQTATPAPIQETIIEEVAAPETDNTALVENAATEEPDVNPTDTPTSDAATVPPISEPEGQTDTGQPDAVSEPIEVTDFTPAQGEGPYYTLDKPADQDNDLTVLAGAAGAPAGQIIEFSGKVYNASGMPLAGLTVEIWQTDDSGVYLHPDDPTTAQRDQNFQFYGETITAVDGSYNFRTILPGHYEPRPRHIHVKVKNGQEELLTSQIYFNGDASLETDGIFLDGGSENEYLVMTVEPGQDADGNPILVGEHNLILNTTLSTTTAEATTEEPAAEPVEATANTKLNLNQADGAEFQAAIPDFGNRMVREFLEYRPYISIQQFRREIGKYVDEAQVAAYEQYVFVPVNVDQSDAATLQQLPGVDEAVAAELMAARPFGSSEAFLSRLAEYVSDAELAIAPSYLAAP